MVESESAAYQYVRDYLSFLPSNHFDDAPVINPGLEPEITPHDLELDSIVPDADNMAYDMHEILLRIFDDGDVFEIADQRSPELITAFARVDGRPVGVVANQPMFMSGAIGNEASDKAASFIRFCDSYNLPLVFVVDTPGAMPGVAEETGGIIKRGGRFFNAIVEADVPKVTVIIRKAYGGGVRGDGLQAADSRPELCLADGAYRGHRRGGRGAAAGQAVPGSDCPRGAEDPRGLHQGLQRQHGHAVDRSRARLHRRRDRAARDPVAPSQVPEAVAGTNRTAPRCSASTVCCRSSRPVVCDEPKTHSLTTSV